MNILEEIAKKTKERIQEEKRKVSLDELKEKVRIAKKGRFLNALQKEGMSYICEVKKASPSKGIIAEQFPYLEIAEDYQAAGAAAISVLTEPEYFLGQDRYLEEIARQAAVPVLRKDFTVDPYQIYEAKVLGASAVLLICSILSLEQLKEYLKLARGLGLSALVEAHDGREIDLALEAGAGIIGVNNRNLQDFQVDVSNSLRLRELIPPGVLYVSESGVRTRRDVEILEQNGTDGVLIGETLMRSPDRQRTLRELKGGAG